MWASFLKLRLKSNNMIKFACKFECFLARGWDNQEIPFARRGKILTKSSNNPDTIRIHVNSVRGV